MDALALRVACGGDNQGHALENVIGYHENNIKHSDLDPGTLSILRDLGDVHFRKPMSLRSPQETYLDAGLCDGDGLLLHGLVDGDLVLDVHLVELVNAADAIVSQHQGTGLDRKLVVLRFLDKETWGMVFSVVAECGWAI